MFSAFGDSSVVSLLGMNPITLQTLAFEMLFVPLVDDYHLVSRCRTHGGDDNRFSSSLYINIAPGIGLHSTAMGFTCMTEP